MWIERDLSKFLTQNNTLPIQIVWGPRQCGKSSLLNRISQTWSKVTLDDLAAHQTANKDPALFLLQHPPPVVIDEVQYAAPLFSQLKLSVDTMRDKIPRPQWPQFRLTGSNQILVDLKIKESLAGRASFYRLHGFSISELRASGIEMPVEAVVYRGGWPELAVSPDLSVVDYLNDYIRTVVDRDVAIASGVRDLEKFHRSLGLLAARVGELTNFERLSGEVGVSGVTLRHWVTILERSGVAGLLRPFHTNLNKRLLKAPKFYFLDTGLAARLQGHLDIGLMFRSPQMGHLFENLVLTEILKCRDHHRKSWNLYFWRTKEGEEYDFIVEMENSFVVVEAKMAIQSAQPIRPSNALLRDLSSKPIRLAVCSPGGVRKPLSRDCLQVPVTELADFLLENPS